jgi:uncharacterized membrane protein YphA (DoxX/SURF4 family)
MDTVAKFVSVYLRLALGTAFLSAVADRFGLWGPPGARNVGWGDFAHFMSYTAQLSPWAPPAVIPVLAWLATAAETVLGIALVLGFLPRLAGLLSGIVLLLFALGMCVGTGVKSTARSRDDGARSRREAAAHRVRGISFIVEPSRLLAVRAFSRSLVVMSFLLKARSRPNG